jgi:hypothetical protein
VTNQSPRSPGVGDEFALDLTRRPVSSPTDGQLAWESTITAPTEWVPYAYTTGELRLVAARRRLSTTALVFGALGLVVMLFTIWGFPLSLVAIVLALTATQLERPARGRWLPALLVGLVGMVIAAGWLVYILNVAPGHAS